MTDNNIINEITLDENDGISYAVDFVLSALGIKKACKNSGHIKSMRMRLMRYV